MAASAAATTRRCINPLPGTIDRSEPHRRPLSYTVVIVVSGHFIWIISDTITAAALADLFGVSIHARRFRGALQRLHSTSSQPSPPLRHCAIVAYGWPAKT